MEVWGITQTKALRVVHKAIGKEQEIRMYRMGMEVVQFDN